MIDESEVKTKSPLPKMVEKGMNVVEQWRWFGWLVGWWLVGTDVSQMSQT